MLFQDSTGISSSSTVYSITQGSVLNSSNLDTSNSGNEPSQLSVSDEQSHKQVTSIIFNFYTSEHMKFENMEGVIHAALIFIHQRRKCFILMNHNESGSTAGNASARISSAQHFFLKCHLLDTKSVNCSTDKSMPYVYHILFSSSWWKKCFCSNFQADDRIFVTVKNKSSIFFI